MTLKTTNVRLLLLPIVLLLSACTASAPILIASLGIAGAGLVTYCTAAGNTCPPSVVSYGGLIIREATADAIIWEGGATTSAKVTQIIANLNADIAAGQALAGLSPQAQVQIQAILTTTQALIPLFEALLTKSPSGARISRNEIFLPHLTPNDVKALAKMKRDIAMLPVR